MFISSKLLIWNIISFGFVCSGNRKQTVWTGNGDDLFVSLDVVFKQYLDVWLEKKKLLLIYEKLYDIIKHLNSWRGTAHLQSGDRKCLHKNKTLKLGTEHLVLRCPECPKVLVLLIASSQAVLQRRRRVHDDHTTSPVTFRTQTVGQDWRHRGDLDQGFCTGLILALWSDPDQVSRVFFFKGQSLKLSLDSRRPTG